MSNSRTQPINALVKQTFTEAPRTQTENENQGRGSEGQGRKVSDAVIAAILLSVFFTSVNHIYEHFNGPRTTLAAHTQKASRGEQAHK